MTATDAMNVLAWLRESIEKDVREHQVIVNQAQFGWAIGAIDRALDALKRDTKEGDES